MYLVRTKYKDKYNYFLVMIDSNTNQRCKRYVVEELAINLINHCGIKLFENISQEIKEI